MATVTGPQERVADGVYSTSWTPFVASGDVSTPLRAANYPYKHITYRGTIAGAPTVVIEVSDDGVNYVTGEDDGGSPLSFSTVVAVATAFLPNQYVRARCTAGAGGAAIEVVVVSSSPSRRA